MESNKTQIIDLEQKGWDRRWHHEYFEFKKSQLETKVLGDISPTNYDIWHRIISNYKSAYTQDIKHRYAYVMIDVWQNLQKQNYK